MLCRDVTRSRSCVKKTQSVGKANRSQKMPQNSLITSRSRFPKLSLGDLRAIVRGRQCHEKVRGQDEQLPDCTARHHGHSTADAVRLPGLWSAAALRVSWLATALVVESVRRWASIAPPSSESILIMFRSVLPHSGIAKGFSRKATCRARAAGDDNHNDYSANNAAHHDSSNHNFINDNSSHFSSD